MNESLMFLLAALVAGLLAAMLLLFPLLGLFAPAVERRRLPLRTINGWLPWAAATLLGTAAALLVRPALGWAALLATIAGPLITAGFIGWRIGSGLPAGADRREFELTDSGVRRTGNGPLTPGYARVRAETGEEGTGAPRAVITLFDGDRAIAENEYGDEESYTDDRLRLVREFGVPIMDLVLAVEYAGNLYSVVLSDRWAAAVLPGFERLSEQSRRFWRPLVGPELAQQGELPVSGEALEQTLSELEERVGLREQPRLARRADELRRLVGLGPLFAYTAGAYITRLGQLPGGGEVTIRREDGLNVARRSRSS